MMQQMLFGSGAGYTTLTAGTDEITVETTWDKDNGKIVKQSFTELIFDKNKKIIKSKSSQGFSLVLELLVVVAILGILSTTGVIKL